MWNAEGMHTIKILQQVVQTAHVQWSIIFLLFRELKSIFFNLVVLKIEEVFYKIKELGIKERIGLRSVLEIIDANKQSKYTNMLSKPHMVQLRMIFQISSCNQNRIF